MRKNFSNKKGLSEVIAVVIIILLVIVTTTVVWNVVNKTIESKTQSASSCFDVGFSSQLTLNNDYTCYNSSSGEVQFSISRGDANMEKIIVSISAGGNSKGFTLGDNASIVEGLYSYPSRQTNLTMPQKNSGLTYIATGFYQSPEWVKIAPVVDGKQCDATDTIYDIYDCSLFSD